MKVNPESGVIYGDSGWMPFYYGFCPDEACWVKEMQRLNVNEDCPYPDSPGRCTIFEYRGDLTCIVTICDEAIDFEPAQVAGIIAHEAMHVWQRMMKHIGEKKPSVEFGAYSYQAIYQNLLDAYAQSRDPGLFGSEKTRQKALKKMRIAA